MAPRQFDDQQIKKMGYGAIPVNTTNPAVGSEHILPTNARFTRENLARDKDLARRIKKIRPRYGDHCVAEEAYSNNPEQYMPCDRITCRMTHDDQLAWTTTREYKEFHWEKYGLQVDEDKPFGAVLEDAVKNGKFNLAIRKMEQRNKNTDLAALNPQVKALHQDVMNYRHPGAPVNSKGQTKYEAKQEREKFLFR
jgi:hypothetical protein